MKCAWQKQEICEYHIFCLKYINREEHLKDNNTEVDCREVGCEDVY
jgi:hypothetical protein